MYNIWKLQHYVNFLFPINVSCWCLRDSNIRNLWTKYAQIRCPFHIALAMAGSILSVVGEIPRKIGNMQNVYYYAIATTIIPANAWDMKILSQLATYIESNSTIKHFKKHIIVSLQKSGVKMDWFWVYYQLQQG